MSPCIDNELSLSHSGSTDFINESAFCLWDSLAFHAIMPNTHFHFVYSSAFVMVSVWCSCKVNYISEAAVEFVVDLTVSRVLQFQS